MRCTWISRGAFAIGRCSVDCDEPDHDERCGGRNWQQEFIEQALRLTHPVAGMVVMLGRREYALGKTRAHLSGVPPHAGKIALRERPAWFDPRQAPLITLHGSSGTVGTPGRWRSAMSPKGSL